MLGIPAEAGEGGDPVADVELAALGGAGDESGDLGTRDEGQRGSLDPIEAAGEKGVGERHTGRLDVDEELAGAAIGSGEVDDLDRGGTIEPGDLDCAHVATLSPVRTIGGCQRLPVQSGARRQVPHKLQEQHVKIGIVIGSIREGSVGQSVADWILAQVEDNTAAEFTVLDLKEFNVPLLTSATVPGAANKVYDSPEATAWSQAVDVCDGFIFVTPEYNHSVPGAFKNAFDSLGSEWGGKTVAFVSYGAEGGVRCRALAPDRVELLDGRRSPAGVGCACGSWSSGRTGSRPTTAAPTSSRRCSASSSR